MSEIDDCRMRSDACLREATRTQDLGERSRLIAQAVSWNEKALELARKAEQQATVVPFQSDSTAP